ncbi:MAG: gamma carbonic anhydrase family protein [Alphaproteobacteria bacterium]
MPRIYELDGVRPEIHPEAYIAPGAILIGNIRVAKGASIWFNAVLRGDNEYIDIQENSSIQDGAVLHTDIGFPLIVEQGVTVGHNVILHGCHLKKGCLIGMGASVLNGAVIGEESLVGANALVGEGKTFEPRQLIVGAPARAIKELNESALARMEGGARFYVENGRRFTQNMKLVDRD